MTFSHGRIPFFTALMLFVLALQFLRCAVVLLAAERAVDARQTFGVHAAWRRISVVIERPVGERGPDRCPASMRPLLEALQAPSPATRLDAKKKLAALDRRHLDWLVDESRKGGVERRLSIGHAVRQLRRSRYEGTPHPARDK